MVATEEARLKALIDAGVATDEDTARYKELTGGKAETPAPAATEEPAATGDALSFEDSVDEASFKRGGSQYFMPSEEGFFKSKLVETLKPDFTKSAQRWFIYETDDPKLDSQGRGVICAELTKGSFKLKDILDGHNIPYKVVNGVVKYKLALPIGCYADWSRDAKGLGEVRITGLRTLEAGATVEKAI